MLDPGSGFFPDVQMDAQAVQAVLALRIRLGEPPRQLDDPDRYLDRRYRRDAMAG